MRQSLLPYGRQNIEEDDIAAVAEVLRSDFLTTGPKVAEFERAFGDFVGTREAVAVSSGTAALHAAMHVLAVGPGDEVIVPAMTFAASANCVVFQGGTPVFVDVDPDTLLLDPAQAERRVTPRTKAMVAVDYAGQPADYDKLRAVAERHRLKIVSDACHSLGGSYAGRPVGSLSELNAFSLHPVKHITSGEGGVITTDNSEFAKQMRIFRNHGITTEHRQREAQRSCYYEMATLGYNYRLTDFQCALALSQLRKLPAWIAKRQEIAKCYDAALVDLPAAKPLTVRPQVFHAYHLYVIQLDLGQLDADRSVVFNALRAENIGVNVHYLPVHLHPFYRSRFGTGPGLCPVAETAYERIITLPIFPQMTEGDVGNVVEALRKVCQAYGR